MKFASYPLSSLKGDLSGGLGAGERQRLLLGLLTVAIEYRLLKITTKVPSVLVALLGAIDSPLTSVMADNIAKTKHDSRRELIGQGIGIGWQRRSEGCLERSVPKKLPDKSF